MPAPLAKTTTGPDFIGLGAQRCGTSWIYSCLFEHPQIHSPIKEIHFFSRERNWRRGYGWYESRFAGARIGSKIGEFSTSYLATEVSAQRIHARYPDVRLVVSLRNPVDRAYSNYTNDLRTGFVPRGTSFTHAAARHGEYFQQGRYERLLTNYLEIFPRNQLLVLIYEDSVRDPRAFVQRIYGHLGVDRAFSPRMLDRRINAGYVPRALWIDRLVRRSASILRGNGLSSAWWLGKRLGIADGIRAVNRTEIAEETPKLGRAERLDLLASFEQDIRFIENLVDRRLEEWRQ